MKLIHSRQHEALYKKVEGVFRAIDYSDGLQSIFDDAISECSRICKEHSFDDIESAFKEQGQSLSHIELGYLAQAGCSGCEVELWNHLASAEKQRNQEDYVDVLLSLAFLDIPRAFLIMEEICERKHWVYMAEFWLTFDGLEEVPSPRANALILKYSGDDVI